MCLFISVLPGIPSQYLLGEVSDGSPDQFITKRKPEQLEQITHCSEIFIVDNKKYLLPKSAAIGTEYRKVLTCREALVQN